MGKVYIFDHPLIQHKLSLMRDVHTGAKEFRELLEEISRLMVYEVTRDLPTKEVISINTSRAMRVIGDAERDALGTKCVILS